MRRWSGALLAGPLGLALALSTAGCTSTHSPAPPSASGSATASGGPSGSACAQASSDLVGAVQRYVDAYGTPLTGTATGAATGNPDDKQFQAAVQAAQDTVRAKACDLPEFRRSVEAGLSSVKARGPVAHAVLLRLTASMTGTAKATAATITVRPTDDLPRRLADLAAGSVVVLVAGRYRLDASLALLEGVTVRGAGRDKTTIESSAAEAGVLVLTDGRVEFRDLTVSHSGKATGDLLVGGPTSALVLTRVRATGALLSKTTANGGNGVLMTSRAGNTKGRGTTLEVTDSTFDHNAAAGIVVTGVHVASIRKARFEANQNCGVCFSGTSTGAVRDSAFVGNRIGVAVLEHAKPAIDDTTFSGGLFAIQAANASTPVIRTVRISGASKAAMIFADTSGGSVDSATCVEVPYGIVVSPEAAPLLGTNSCTLAEGK